MLSPVAAVVEEVEEARLGGGGGEARGGGGGEARGGGGSEARRWRRQS